jgi:hypothetical protein
MSAQLLWASSLAAAGIVCAVIAVWTERRMQRHRRPGVTYADVTHRRDGAWRNAALYTAAGLRLQARAARFGAMAAAFWVLALAAWVALSGTSGV